MAVAAQSASSETYPVDPAARRCPGLNAVSTDTTRWLLDDARDAYHDPGHPCHRFSKTQGHLAWEHWQLPVPFLGRVA